MAEAIERLNADGERFVFFANQATGRGNVLYHRYDGHYGLITPNSPMTEHRESPLTLPKLCRARRDDDVYEVRVPKPIADRARLAIERMVALA